MKEDIRMKELQNNFEIYYAQRINETEAYLVVSR